MDPSDSLAGLQSLHRDLLSLNEARLANLERLLAELESHIEDFRGLLDRPGKNEKSRKTLSTEDTLSLDEVTYSVNEEFKQETIQISDVLNLDELESAKLFIAAQEDSEELDRTPLVCAIIRFHKKRHFLLECLRLIVKQSTDPDCDDDIRAIFRNAVGFIVKTKDGSHDNGSLYWRKCFSELADIEGWLQQLAERSQSVSMIGQEPSVELVEILEFQRSTLTGQHESLAAVLSHLVEGAYVRGDEIRLLLSKLKSLDKHDVILIHYIPIFTCAASLFGSSRHSGSVEEATSIHQLVTGNRDGDAWNLRSFHAAVVAWWLAEYNGRDVETLGGSPRESARREVEAEDRSKLFMNALRDGAFQFMLSVSQDIISIDWHDPGKHALNNYLLQEATRLPSDAILPSDHFQSLIMEQFQSFVDSLISNMPDTIRRLKVEEDDQRRFLHSRFQRSLVDYEPHLERLLILISYAFEGSIEASQAFWSDPEGNLFGFLQWASKRQTTPRAAAFCEMLRSISQGEESAASAHKFLLEESASTSAKIRRTSALSWNQMFAELQFYAAGVKEKGGNAFTDALQTNLAGTDQVMEPESAMMLESYLRLIAHLCKESSEAREWVIRHPSFRLHEILLLLCGSGIGSRLRACSFTALTSLLTHKTPEVGEGMWTALDQWVYGVLLPTPSLAKSSSGAILPSRSDQAVFESIAADFEEFNAFVGLLQALILPYPEDNGVSDKLPFPENLGSAYRMPGIDSYVDFVANRGLGGKSQEVHDPVQSRILRWNCLSFIATCLSTFNEDLVVFANDSSINIDSAIESSSLSAYFRFHPFARAMEWLFTDKVLNALFAATHQDVEEVNRAKSESPLILSLVRSVDVMNLIMTLQSTYLDIVRPLIRAQVSSYRQIITTSALASFEDAVLNNLYLIVDLGLYCGTGHQELTIASLNLLERLSSARKLIFSSSTGIGQRSDRNSRIISVLEKDNECERISQSLVSKMVLEVPDLEAGPASPAFIIKTHILNFLNTCLANSSDRPSMAHILLGFSCHKNSINIPDTGLFAKGKSLFHAVVRLLLDCPDGTVATTLPWLNSLKQGCMEVLRKLWKSQLSSTQVMAELRTFDFLFMLSLKQTELQQFLIPEDRSEFDAANIHSNTSEMILQGLQERSAYFEYSARELKVISESGAATLKARIQSTLLGNTILSDGEQVRHLTLFDLFDFIRFEHNAELPRPSLKYLTDLDFTVCKSTAQGPWSLYDMRKLEELLVLRVNELRKRGHLRSAVDEEDIRSEEQALLLFFDASNQRHMLAYAKFEALTYWVQVMSVVMQSFDSERSSSISFILQTLQIIVPQLEQAFSVDVFSATHLSSLSRTLIEFLYFNSTSSGKGNMTDFGGDKSFQLYRICLKGVCSPLAGAEIRETCYQILYRYVYGACMKEPSASSLSNQALRTLKSTGHRFMDIICDDAYAGQGTCRVSSLLLLEAFVALEQRGDTTFVIESLVRLNFLALLVDGTKNMANDLGSAGSSEVALLLSFYDASLTLLLRISQTRQGAVHVLQSGLFQSVRDSQLFATDPDIGLEIQNPDALDKYFGLMLAVLRVIVTTVVSRGTQSDNTLANARQFLEENRQSIVAVFKRNANLGGMQSVSSVCLDELVDNFTLLMHLTGFLEYEEKTGLQQPARNFLS